MSFDYKPVTLDEYNQSLRDTVNAYYTYAISNSDMSKEDALKSTGEMTEKYLEAVEEFQGAQLTQTQAATIENSAEAGGLVDSEIGTAVGNGLSNEGELDVGEETTSEISEDSEGVDGGEDCEDGLDP